MDYPSVRGRPVNFLVRYSWRPCRKETHTAAIPSKSRTGKSVWFLLRRIGLMRRGAIAIAQKLAAYVECRIEKLLHRSAEEARQKLARAERRPAVRIHAEASMRRPAGKPQRWESLGNLGRRSEADAAGIGLRC